MKKTKILLIFFIAIALSGCLQKKDGVKFYDFSYKAYIEDNILNVGYSVEIDNYSSDTYSLVIPKLPPEIEELVISKKELVTELVPNSSNSISTTFTVNVNGISEEDRKELLQKELIRGFYISKYFEVKVSNSNKH